MKKICIYQPNVFPRLHYFNRILNSDVWVMLDDVQLNRRVGQTCFAVKLNGRKHTIVVPVFGGNRVNIKDAVISYDLKWIAKAQKTMEHAYGKRPYFERIRALTASYFNHHRWNGADFRLFCEQFTLDMLRKFGWQGVVMSSSGLAGSVKASERMAEITLQLRGTHYVCGKEGYQNYLNLQDFRSRKLSIYVQEWKSPVYPQGKGDFIANLSILDLLTNVDLEEARKLLVSDGMKEWKEYGLS
ncbi:WbqC family protein [Paenibacillus abyssi]|uniref:WbqC family protein n=1 Tax=Paenibacillus abyssi TaxID=1340531 RepID=UPI0016650668|nr:WbqC family protein [Paenibacillus abyssi]